MPDQLSLDGVLDESTPESKTETPKTEAPAPDAPPVETVRSNKKEHQAKEYAAQGRDPETGQFVPKEAPTEATETPKAAEAPVAPVAPQAPAQPVLTEKERGFYAAAVDERRKRQAVETELAALRASKPAEPPKQFWDDPEAALRATEERVQGAIQQTRMQTAEAIARSRYQDFDEKIASFANLAQQTPGLAQQCVAASDPAEFAYRMGKNHQELQQVGGLDQMRAKIEKETEAKVRAQVETELKAKADALAAERAKLPGSLSSTTSTGANRPVWGGPTALDNVLKG